MNKREVRGIALVNALVFTAMIVIFVTTLYTVFNRLFKITEEARTFTSVREAAASGVRYGASMINFSNSLGGGPCATFTLDFKIVGREEGGKTDITVCKASSLHMPGQELSGTSREPVGGAGGVYKIISISSFPANNPVQEARVEAVYVHE
ncbi:MAG: hypothetical protein ACK4VK_08210 [Aquificaceae bacterium]